MHTPFLVLVCNNVYDCMVFTYAYVCVCVLLSNASMVNTATVVGCRLAKACMYLCLVVTLVILLFSLQSVFESKGFSEVSADTLSYLLQSDRLAMEEEDILDKVKEWANISSVSEQCSVSGR